MTRPRSLRFRLVAAAVATAILGMVVVNVVAVLTLRSSLLHQVDEQLSAVPGAGLPPGGVPTPPAGSPTAAPTDGQWPGATGNPDPQFLDTRVVARLDPDTGEVLTVVTGPRLSDTAAPDLTTLSASIAAGEALATGTVWIADATGDPQAYRARVLSPPTGSTRDIVVVARSMADVEATIRRVTLVDAGVSVLVVLLLTGLGTALVRVGLRPLSDVEDAAEQIASGDLGVRAPHADEQTEVGSLARTFNAMVDTVTGALDERDASERRMRQVLADASHELRTPVTAIRAWAELFRQGVIPAEDEALAAVARIEVDAERMGRLVEDLLLLARLDQHPELRLEDVDLGRVCEEVVAMLAATAPGHTVSLEAAPGTVVRADEDAVRRVVSNLVRNALVHTPQGTRVGLLVHRGPGLGIIEVGDDGPGMPPDVAAHAFDRFYRPDSGRARAVAGSGLGLAIVRSLVRAHEGSVRVDTAPGEGATFVVELPVGGPTDSTAFVVPALDSTPTATPQQTPR